MSSGHEIEETDSLPVSLFSTLFCTELPRFANPILRWLGTAAFQDFGNFNAPPFARRTDARQQDGERGRPFLAVHLRLALAAHGIGEFLEFLDEGVVLRARHRTRGAWLPRFRKRRPWCRS